MSKFFYKGTPEVMGSYGKKGYNTNAEQKLGSNNLPLTLTVTTKARQTEIQAIVEEHGFCATIEVDSNSEENINELEVLLNKPKTVRFEKTPERNDPCSCGSNKKYKKCCGK